MKVNSYAIGLTISKHNPMAYILLRGLYTTITINFRQLLPSHKRSLFHFVVFHQYCPIFSKQMLIYRHTHAGHFIKPSQRICVLSHDGSLTWYNIYKVHQITKNKIHFIPSLFPLLLDFVI